MTSLNVAVGIKLQKAVSHFSSLPVWAIAGAEITSLNAVVMMVQKAGSTSSTCPAFIGDRGSDITSLKAAVMRVQEARCSTSSSSST